MAQDHKKRIGQEALDRALGNVLHGRHFGHAFGFFGPDALAVEAQAVWFSKKLACQEHADAPCGICEACKSIARADGMVWMHVQPEAEQRNISVERIRTLRKDVALLAGDLPRIIFLPRAERLAGSAANALLKLLEEPGTQTFFVLTATNCKSVLPTIRSRTAWYAVQPIAEADIQQALLNAGYARSTVTQALQYAPGQAQFAAQLCESPNALADQIDAEREMQEMLTLPIAVRFQRLQKLLGKKSELTVDISRAQTLLHQLFRIMRQQQKLWSALPYVSQALLRVRTNAQPRLIVEAVFAALPQTL